MSRTVKRIFLIFLCTVSVMLPLRAGAISLYGYDRVYHKPAITMILLNGTPEADMKVTMVHRNGTAFITLPQKERRMWETYFRIYRAGVEGRTNWFGNRLDVKDAVIMLEDAGQTYTIPIPYEQLKEASYDDYLIIDLKAGTVRVGLPFSRTLAFFLLHLAIYMGVESLLFWLFKFRSPHDWKFFLIYTLLTKSFVCFLIRDCLNTDVRFYLAFAVLTLFYVVGDIGVLLLKLEDDHDKVSKFSAVANVICGFLIFEAMTRLPM